MKTIILLSLVIISSGCTSARYMKNCKLVQDNLSRCEEL